MPQNSFNTKLNKGVVGDSFRVGRNALYLLVNVHDSSVRARLQSHLPDALLVQWL